MYSERLNKIINQVCHAWEEQAAEHEAKMRALANSIVSEHEAERFNTQKAFKSALAAKNNEINSLLSECKKLKALLTHIHSENKELQKKLSMANRTIESLRQGMAYDENGMPISKQGFIGSGDDSTIYASDDSLSVGGGMGMSGIGGDYYGGLDDLSGSHSQLGNWSQQPPPSNRQQQQSQSQQSHLFPRGINSPDSDIYGYNPGVGGIGLGGGVGVGGNGVSGGGDINRGYFADNEPSIRGPPPSSLSDGRGSGNSGGGGGGIGGLFTSSSTSSSSSIPSVSTSSNQHFPSRGVPSHGLVYGGRFVLESAGEDPPSLYPRDDYQVDRSGSYDLTRADRESDEYNQHSGYLDDSSSQIPGQSQSQVNAANATTSKRLSPSAPSFMPGSTSLQGNLNKNNVTQLGSVGNSPVTRSNSSSSQSNNNNNINNNNNNNNNGNTIASSSSSILNPSVDFNQNPPPPPGFESYSTSRDPFYEDGQQIITNPIDPSSNSSLSNIGLEVDSSSSIILNDKDNYDGQLSSPPLSQQTNEAGTVSVINQMRLQSKSSKLDAKPLLSSPTSPTTTTSNSSASSSSSNITNNNNNNSNNNFNIIPSSSLSNPLPSNSSSFPPSNLYSEGL